MWQHVGVPAIPEEEGTRQATADMQYEGWQCSEDECHLLADRPDCMVEGQAIDRQSEEYQQLIRRAYQAMSEQNERFRAALIGESLFLQHYSQVVHFSGEHRMDDKVIENVLVPLIYKCVAK